MELADRGVFQGWSESSARGRTSFRFRWLLGHEFNLVADPEKGELVLRDLLPGVEHRSFIDSDLRRFVANRIDPALPPHRRLDADRVTVTYTNRRQNVSLVMRVLAADYEYASRALLGLANDLFTHLQLNHVDYLVRSFGLPEE